MKKLFLLMAVMATSFTCVSAQTKNVEIPPLYSLTPNIPNENDGWKLISTSKTKETMAEVDLTCYEYVKEVDDDEIHRYVYERENGDYFISSTPSSYRKNADGGYKWTDRDGIIEQQLGKIKHTIYPNGNIEQEIEGQEELHALYLPDNPKEGYKYTEIIKFAYERIQYDLEDLNYYDYKDEGFLIKDRIYGMDEKGNFAHTYQVINGKFFPACSTDTITEIKEYTSNDGDKVFEVLYKNGDNYKIGTGYHAGTLHRKNGIIRILKNGSISYRLNDGSRLEFAYNVSGKTFALLQILAKEDPALTGWMTDANGNKEYYENGISESQKKKIDEEREARIAAEEAAKEKAIRDGFIKKYGYYPGDYNSIKQVIKVGRKFGAIEEFFPVSLQIDRGVSKQYKVNYNSWGGYAYVWVRNGIITSVTF